MFNIIPIQDFRRFVVLNIYPELISLFVIPQIVEAFNCDIIEYDGVQSIKFNYNSNINLDANVRQDIHNKTKDIFINFFNNQEVIKYMRNKVYTGNIDVNMKENLKLVLDHIQMKDQQYISLLFNITFLKDNMIYLYL